jgi:hypothetical protein
LSTSRRDLQGGALFCQQAKPRAGVASYFADEQNRLVTKSPLQGVFPYYNKAMEHHFSIEESVRFGWAKMRTHSTLVFKSLLTIFAIQIAQDIVVRVLAGTLEGAVAGAALVVLSVVLGIGFTRMTFKIVKGEHTEFADLIPPMNIWMAYLAASILAALVSVVPLLVAFVICLAGYAYLPGMAAIILCVVVAVMGFIVAAYLALRYSFVRFAILEHTNIIESLRVSARVTSGKKWWLLGFFIVIGLLNILGAVLFLVGLLVTVPVTMFAYAHVYQKLHAHHASK